MGTPTRSAWYARALSSILVLGAFLVGPSTVSVTQVGAASIGANGQGTLLFVGDSLTVGAAAFGQMTDRIRTTGIWTRVIVDAKVGRKASQGVDVLKKRVGSNTTAIVIALGVNDMISRRETWYPQWVIKKVMQQTAGRPVLWVTPKFSPTGRRDWVARAARFRRALVSARATWPGLTIADWNRAFVPSGAVRFIEDGVHLTISGYKNRATFCVRAVAEFGRAIVDASTTTSSTTTVAETTTTMTTSTTTTLAPG